MRTPKTMMMSAIAVAMLALSASAQAQTAVLVTSDFTSSVDGWTQWHNPAVPNDTMYSATGGFPDGHIFHDDEQGGTAFMAPIKFIEALNCMGNLGPFNQNAFLNGAVDGGVSMDWFSTAIDPLPTVRRAWIQIYAADGSRIFGGPDVTNADANQWIRVELNFRDVNAWRYFDSSGVEIQTELFHIKGVLSNAIEMRVAAETLVGPSEIVRLDNPTVYLNCPTPPDPCPTDINGDGVTDTADLGILLGAFGSNCN